MQMLRNPYNPALAKCQSRQLLVNDLSSMYWSHRIIIQECMMCNGWWLISDMVLVDQAFYCSFPMATILVDLLLRFPVLQHVDYFQWICRSDFPFCSMWTIFSAFAAQISSFAACELFSVWICCSDFQFCSMWAIFNRFAAQISSFAAWVPHRFVCE